MTAEQAGAGTTVRTSILLPAETDRAIRALAKREKRPVTWEIRRAIEDHIERQKAAA